MDKFDLEEKILGGIFGVISIIAAIIELCSNGFTLATIAGTIKDVFATLVVVVLFVTVMRALRPQKPKNFRDLLNNAMVKVEKNYTPLIKKIEENENDTEAKIQKLQTVIRYGISTNVNALFTRDCSNYIRFFDINANTPDSIVFPVRETFFGSTEKSPFNAETIIHKMCGSLQYRFPEYEVSGDFKRNEIVVKFNKTLSSAEDAENLSRLIDTLILLYIAETKKS